MFADPGVTDRPCSLGMSGHRQAFLRGHCRVRRGLEVSVTSSAQDTVSARALKVSLLKLPKRQRTLKDDLRVHEST